MPQFELNGAYGPKWQALDYFVRGYIEALFFTDEAEWQATEDHNEGSFPSECGFEDLAESALASIISDCEDFQQLASDLLAEAYSTDKYDSEQAGRDFWFTRNHHGVGYWDRSALEANGLGDKLTKAAQTYSGVDTYLGDDSKIYHG